MNPQRAAITRLGRGGRPAMRRSDPGINLMRSKHGAMSEIGRRLNLSRQSVEAWKAVPLEYVFTVAAVLLIAPEKLRPDFFANDPLRSHRVAKRTPRCTTPQYRGKRGLP